MKEEKLGMVIGTGLVLGIAAYAFFGGKEKESYLSEWQREQENSEPPPGPGPEEAPLPEAEGEPA